MRVAGRDDGVTAIQIKVALARTGHDPHVLAALDDERKLLVGRHLILLFNVNYVFHLNVFHLRLCAQFGSPCLLGYGLLPASTRPARSSTPNIRFIFCTACPAAPLTRLSSAT